MNREQAIAHNALCTCTAYSSRGKKKSTTSLEAALLCGRKVVNKETGIWSMMLLNVLSKEIKYMGIFIVT